MARHSQQLNSLISLYLHTRGIPKPSVRQVNEQKPTRLRKKLTTRQNKMISGALRIPSYFVFNSGNSRIDSFYLMYQSCYIFQILMNSNYFYNQRIRKKNNNCLLININLNNFQVIKFQNLSYISFKMGPKKQVKKEVVQQAPKQQQPQIPEHQLHGYGKFQYLNGTVYQGNWRLFNAIKMKHGQGILKIPSNSSNGIGAQIYEGTFNQDKMQGYGIYKYACGAIFKGEWKNNKHHGKGIYQFANGTIYQGDWKDHLMHGTGCYIDVNGRKWEGEYRNGKFETRRQKELLHEKEIQRRKQSAKTSVMNTVNSMLEALAKSDKKTFKENFSPFFASGEIIKEQIKQPYSKLDEKPQQKWVDLLNYLKNGKISVLQKPEFSHFLGAERVLAPQLQGPGQVVEMINQTDQRTSKAAFVNTENSLWILVSVFDEEKKK